MTSGTIFGGDCRALLPATNLASNVQESYPSCRSSQACNQDLIHEFRYECGSRARTQEAKRKESRRIREERRALTSPRIYFLRETIEGNFFPGCFHDCLPSPVLMAPGVSKSQSR